MGLAPKQRNRLSTGNNVFAALVPVPLSRRATRVDDGPRERGTGTVRRVFSRFSSLIEHGASPPFSLAFSLCSQCRRTGQLRKPNKFRLLSVLPLDGDRGTRTNPQEVTGRTTD